VAASDWPFSRSWSTRPAGASGGVQQISPLGVLGLADLAPGETPVEEALGVVTGSARTSAITPAAIRDQTTIIMTAMASPLPPAPGAVPVHHHPSWRILSIFTLAQA
jgi:hypothetical protein